MKKNKLFAFFFVLLILILVGIFLFVSLKSELLIKKTKISTGKEKAPVLEKELNIFNWENYLSEEVIKEFEQKYGVKVNLETFDDSDFMFSKIQSQPDKYDLVMAEHDYVSLMKKLKLLSPLEHQKIPNLKYLKKEARENFYDPGNVFCVPYVHGYTGIAINKKYVFDFDGTRKILWDSKYRGKISMLNNAQEILISALFYLGAQNLENPTPEEFEKAINLALKQKDLVLGYDDPTKQRELLINEKAWIAYIYSTEIGEIKQKNPNVEFFAPKEGATLWSDNLCIPRDAPHKEAAHAFLNYLLEPKNSAKNFQDIKVLMVNQGMKEFLDPKFVQFIEGLDFPKEKETLEKSSYFTNVKFNEDFLKAINRLDAELKEKE
jgi:spermidine/putrescine transport system substrate-binding protein